MKLYVLNVRRYSFTTEQKQDIQGVSVVCIGDSVEVTKDFKGKSVVEIKSSDLSAWNLFTAVPAFYDIEFSMATNSRRQTVLKLISAKLLQEQAR
jgi:hypothetical protein